MATDPANGFHWHKVGDELSVGQYRMKVMEVRPGKVRLRWTGPDGSSGEAEISTPVVANGSAAAIESAAVAPEQ